MRFRSGALHERSSLREDDNKVEMDEHDVVEDEPLSPPCTARMYPHLVCTWDASTTFCSNSCATIFTPFYSMLATDEGFAAAGSCKGSTTTMGGGGEGGRGDEEESRGGADCGVGEASATPALSCTYPPEVLAAHFVEMGYPEDLALAAVFAADGNINQALDALSAQDIQVKNDASNTLKAPHPMRKSFDVVDVST